MASISEKQRVFVKPIRPQDLQNGHGMKLGIVHVHDAATGFPASLGGVLFPSRIQGMPQVFRYDTVYVIAPVNQLQSLVAEFLESNGFKVVAQPAHFKA